MSLAVPRRVLVEMRRHLRHGVVGVERADDRLRRAEVVRLDELDLLHQLGVVVAAPHVGRLPADETAGRVRVGPVGRFHQLAEEVAHTESL